MITSTIRLEMITSTIRLEMITSTIRNLIGIGLGSIGIFYVDGTRRTDDGFRF
jgi:hypothetical protein